MASITINRPERYNAFRLKTVEELFDAFERADADGDVGGEADFTPHTAWLFDRRLLNLASDLFFAERANAWLFATRDAAEGRAAFREKRKARFHGA